MSTPAAPTAPGPPAGAPRAGHDVGRGAGNDGPSGAGSGTAGLLALVERLREADLQVPVALGAVIDATRLLEQLARHGPDVASPPSAAALLRLKLQLRPVLCKAAADQPAFDAAFDDWAATMPWPTASALPTSAAVAGEPAADSDSAGVTTVLAAGDPARGSGKQAGADTGPGPGTGRSPGTPRPDGGFVASARSRDPAPAPRPGRRWLAWSLALLAAAALAAALWATRASWWPQPAPLPDRPTAPVPAPGPGNAAGRGATPSPNTPAPAAPDPASDASPAVPPVAAFTPDWRLRESLSLPWLVALLALPLAGLWPLLVAPPPLPSLHRQRGDGNLSLAGLPQARLRRLLVRDVAPATGGQLQRHVRGAVEAREAYARRPVLDLRRTAVATLARGGIVQLHHRFARLRPAYLLLVHADSDDALGVLWARRLAALDVRAALFRFDAATPDAEPLCTELDGLGRRLPFSALPPPWPAQRLVVVARTQALVGDDNRLRDWLRRARLGRWRDRVLFNPDEPRHWPAAQVAALEAPLAAGDPGMLVLPFEDNALGAWSQWLVRGQLPPVELEAPQRYPALLTAGESRFCGDADLAALDADPARAGQIVGQLVSQLQAYLGQNGFYWLCACAVPPLLDTRLALLLGDEYFRRCGASEADLAGYMARNWRLLVRLPWLRPQPQPLPQWLRLLLLARLPAAIQQELREVVRGALGRRTPGDAPGAVRLGFDAPEAASTAADAGAGRTDERYALMVGFVQDGLDARSLMLRLPGAWQAWLPALTARRQRGPRAWARSLRQWLARLGRTDAATRRAAARLAAGGLLISLSGLLALAVVPTANLRPVLGPLLTMDAHGIALTVTGRVALDGSGSQALVWEPPTSAVRILYTPAEVQLASNTLRWLWGGDLHRLQLAAYSARGERAELLDDGKLRLHRQRAHAAGEQPVVDELVTKAPPEVRQMLFAPDGNRLLLLTDREVWQWRPGEGEAEPANGLAVDGMVVGASFSGDGSRISVFTSDGGTLAERQFGSLDPRRPELPAGRVPAGDLVAVSPLHGRLLLRDGHRLVLRDGADVLAGRPGAVLPAAGVVQAVFSPDGSRVLTVGGEIAAAADAELFAGNSGDAKLASNSAGNAGAGPAAVAATPASAQNAATAPAGRHHAVLWRALPVAPATSPTAGRPADLDPALDFTPGNPDRIEMSRAFERIAGAVETPAVLLLLVTAVALAAGVAWRAERRAPPVAVP